jgi:hypothetical protein
MAEDINGVPKGRPTPRPEHLHSLQARDDYNQAVRIVMATQGVTWPEAVKVVEKEKVVNILATHNAPAEAK